MARNHPIKKSSCRMRRTHRRQFRRLPIWQPPPSNNNHHRPRSLTVLNASTVPRRHRQPNHRRLLVTNTNAYTRKVMRTEIHHPVPPPPPATPHHPVLHTARQILPVLVAVSRLTCTHSHSSYLVYPPPFSYRIIHSIYCRYFIQVNGALFYFNYYTC